MIKAPRDDKKETAAAWQGAVSLRVVNTWTEPFPRNDWPEEADSGQNRLYVRRRETSEVLSPHIDRLLAELVYPDGLGGGRAVRPRRIITRCSPWNRIYRIGPSIP